MVNAQFGLRDNPFRLTPDLGVRCDCASFAATRDRISAAMQEGRKLVLIGESGVGKTLLLRSLGQELGPLGAIYLVCGRHFGPADLSRALDGSPPSILLLDDAHHLDSAMLADLLGRDGAVALGATPGFSAIGLDHLTLAPLQPEEVSAYVHCRLSAAGWSGGDLFDAAACERLWRFSQGAARRINNLSSAALFLASQRQASRIDAELIEAAAAGLSLQPPPVAPPAAPRRRSAAPRVPPAADSPMIVAAFMRERVASPPSKPDDAALVAPARSSPATDAAPDSLAPEPVSPRIPEAELPATAGTLLAAADSARASHRQEERLLTAPAIPRWADDVEPPPSPRPSSRATPIALAFGLVALAALGLAWRMELAPKPDFQIDWARVQAVTSPDVGPAAASEDSRLAVVVRETTPADVAGAPPIVFPNIAPQAEPPAALVTAPPSPAPLAPAPVLEPPAPATLPSPAPVVEPSAPAVEAAPAPAAPPAETPAQPAPLTSPAPAAQSATAPGAPPPDLQQFASAAMPDTGTAASRDGEERIAELLAQARRLALAFALTTPPGQSAYDSYREVLAIEPRRQEALAGLDEIAAKYDDLAGLGRQRDKPALVQLYESRAAQVRRERARLASESASPQGAAR